MFLPLPEREIPRRDAFKGLPKACTRTGRRLSAPTKAGPAVTPSQAAQPPGGNLTPAAAVSGFPRAGLGRAARRLPGAPLGGPGRGGPSAGTLRRAPPPRLSLSAAGEPGSRLRAGGIPQPRPRGQSAGRMQIVGPRRANGKGEGRGGGRPVGRRRGRWEPMRRRGGRGAPRGRGHANLV